MPQRRSTSGLGTVLAAAFQCIKQSPISSSSIEAARIVSPRAYLALVRRCRYRLYTELTQLQWLQVSTYLCRNRCRGLRDGCVPRVAACLSASQPAIPRHLVHTQAMKMSHIPFIRALVVNCSRCMLCIAASRPFQHWSRPCKRQRQPAIQSP
jgi:hypothetical protein